MTIDALRLELIEKLVHISITQTHEGRNTLIGGIPGAVYFQRDPGNQRNDITLLVDQLMDRYSQAGKWYLLVLIDNALPALTGTQAGEELRLLRQKLRRWQEGTSHQAIQPYTFDLQAQEQQCLNALWQAPRLTGFLIPTTSQRFFKNFCLRLKHYGLWDAKRVMIKDHLKVEAPHTTVDFAAATIGRYKRLLREVVILQTIEVTQATDADALWAALCDTYAGDLDNYLVVIFGSGANCAPPPGVQPLGPPQFTQADVFRWVREIVVSLGWPLEFGYTWTNLIVQQCSYNQELHVDWVYEHLEEEIPVLLQTNPTYEAFCQALQE